MFWEVFVDGVADFCRKFLKLPFQTGNVFPSKKYKTKRPEKAEVGKAWKTKKIRSQEIDFPSKVQVIKAPVIYVQGIIHKRS